MGTEHYIAELLYRYNCVMVPEFGAFLTQVRSAVINESNNTFLPPTKTVSFNEQLTSNDGLLVSYMADVEKMSYEDMQKKIALVSQQWRQRLEAGEKLGFPNLGQLWLNKEGKTQFQPSNEVNYLTSSFGLSSFVASPITREVLKEEILELEEKIPFIITPEARKESGIRPYLKYAAVILLAVATSFTGYRLYNENLNNQQLVRQEAQQQVSKNIQEATFFNTAPLELPVISLNISTPKKRGAHQIIAGAFRIKENAEKKVDQLKEKGYDSSYIGENDYGLHMVAYGCYDDADEALQQLRTIKLSESSEAWMRSVK
ncbi:SPOR domain-containing protein [Arenibacter sp. H213]|uniref:SPOR domain-containing protein n=2 Tax=Arenibacter antarcticus TaxID=2040469 RepID=A0ABW5VAC8_9FLAO|nr:SPOR domain-containing protein [Arenibacter sp. H213]MCM4167932.1 SPOR domain-containing protein [Arenibacter sp. H213]